MAEKEMNVKAAAVPATDKKKKEKVHLKPNLHNKTVRPTTADHVFQILVDVFMVFILIVIVVPVWSTITLSFRPNTYIGTYLEGMFLPPWDWSIDAYKALLGNDGFAMAFFNSLKILVGGVFCALFLTIPMAYVMSIKTLPGRKILSTLVIIPYVFNVGMIPAYLLVTGIGLQNHLASVFLPGAISTYNLIIMRQFFDGIPGELKESARIDGCSEIQVLIRIIMPLSKAIIMTIGLYYGSEKHSHGFRYERVRRGQCIRKCSCPGDQGGIGIPFRNPDGNCLSVHTEVFHKGYSSRFRKGLMI